MPDSEEEDKTLAKLSFIWFFAKIDLKIKYKSIKQLNRLWWISLLWLLHDSKAYAHHSTTALTFFRYKKSANHRSGYGGRQLCASPITTTATTVLQWGSFCTSSYSPLPHTHPLPCCMHFEPGGSAATATTITNEWPTFPFRSSFCRPLWELPVHSALCDNRFQSGQPLLYLLRHLNFLTPSKIE